MPPVPTQLPQPRQSVRLGLLRRADTGVGALRAGRRAGGVGRAGGRSSLARSRPSGLGPGRRPIGGGATVRRGQEAEGGPTQAADCTEVRAQRPGAFATAAGAGRARTAAAGCASPATAASPDGAQARVLALPRGRVLRQGRYGEEGLVVTINRDACTRRYNDNICSMLP